MIAGRPEQQDEQQSSKQERDRSPVDSSGMCEDPVEKPLTPIRPVSKRDSERGCSAIDKVVAYMTFRGSLARAGPGKLDGLTRHGQLVGLGSPGDFLDHFPVPVVGGEILVRIDPGWVFAEDLLDQTAALEEGIPVHG